jgi:hypothetical protein
LGALALIEAISAAINWRPPPVVSPPSAGQDFTIAPGSADVPYRLQWFIRSEGGFLAPCPGQSGFDLGPDNNNGPYEAILSGRTIRLVRIQINVQWQCGSGPTSTGPATVAIQNVKADGTVENVYNIGADTIFQSTVQGTKRTFFERFQVSVNGGPLVDLVNRTTTEAPPGIQPLVDDVPDALPALPALVPVVAPARALPAAQPEAEPMPVPATVPGGLPATAPAPVPAPAAAPTRRPRPARVPAQPAPVPVPARGPLGPPAPLPVPVTPGEVVVIDGQPISGPGQAPAPNLQAMAQELGRLERKAELMLERQATDFPNDVLAEGIAQLLELLSSVDAGGSYSIRPACGTDANGDPLPVIEVPIEPGIGLSHAVTARLDAIAELIDHHKQLRQPICKGKPTGQSVTVTALEVE